ncbi:MAG TPA: hypothetical protein VEW74_09430 [Candidatus Nitrosotalea sp.]|nr:hypothetical protein [Candidatus Nitrosotalea sp.]
MSEKRDLREGVEDADDTGLVAGEELITEAETLLPLERPSVPSEELHAALPQQHAAHGLIDALHAQVQGAKPDRDTIERHVGQLRGLPELEAIVVTWWEQPVVQRFIGNLGQIGL